MKATQGIFCKRTLALPRINNDRIQDRCRSRRLSHAKRLMSCGSKLRETRAAGAFACNRVMQRLLIALGAGCYRRDLPSTVAKVTAQPWHDRIDPMIKRARESRCQSSADVCFQ
jgi:hypothetical protein